MTFGSQRCRAALLLLIVAVVAATGSPADAANTVLKFEIGNVGPHVIDDFYVRLLDKDAPITVNNFLTYVSFGDYDGSFFHRLAYDFVLQGGGFYYDSVEGPIPVWEDPPIVNEFGHSNVRGTIAMAKLGSGPDTATNQFFFNLNDNNASNLDFQNGGFTVFAYVIGDGMDVVDQLAAYPPNPFEVGVYDYGSPFDSLPLISYDGGLWLETIISISVVGVDGDVDFDGDVDDDDYSAFTASFGQSGLGLAADFDGDDDVDLDDFAVLRANYTGLAPPSPLPTPGGAVPEPGSIFLLGLCGMAIIRKRRGKS